MILSPLLGSKKGEHSAGDGFDPFHAALCEQRLPCDIHSGCSTSPRQRCWQEPLASPSWEDWVCSQLRMELPPQQAGKPCHERGPWPWLPRALQTLAPSSQDKAPVCRSSTPCLLCEPADPPRPSPRRAGATVLPAIVPTVQRRSPRVMLPRGGLRGWRW